MKCKIPEISWHNRDPVLSVDIQKNSIAKNAESTVYRLASGGTDAHVLIWHMSCVKNGVDISLELAADLTRHQKAVNTVRWSPNGEMLASGDDESVVFIWKQKSENEVLNILDDANEGDKEIWIILKVLRGHREDIYDLSWSPNSQFLITGSVDNTAMMWNVHKGKSTAILHDHKGYVQGVAWDPRNQYVATMCTDRYMRLFDIQTKKVVQRTFKSKLPVPKDHELYDKQVRLFHDGTLQTFFRRLCFTPDGNLLLTPAGITDYDGVLKPTNTTYAFKRFDLSQPVLCLPTPDQYTVAVRCSPVLYRLRPYNACPPIVDLPYRMVFAVATKSSIYFYDTQQKPPFAVISNIHYTRLTDLTWSGDGRIVVVSSTDGFCSLISFGPDDIGEIYEDSEQVLKNMEFTHEVVQPTVSKSKKHKKRKATDDKGLREPLKDKQNNAMEQSDRFVDDKDNGLEEKQNTSLDETSNDSKEITSTTSEEDTENLESSFGNASISDLDGSENDLLSNAENVAEPIAIKRKPDVSSEENQNATKGNEAKSKVAMPIAIKRKPGPVTECEKMETSTNGSVSKTATPIAIKRKPGISDEKNPSTMTGNEAQRKVAMPIAIKRKPGPVTECEGKECSTNGSVSKIATPTEVGVKVEENTSQEKQDEEKQNSSTIALNRKLSTENLNSLNVDIVIDKEILSVHERFESPEKKSHPVTPIMVRRNPRTPNSGAATSTPTPTPTSTSSTSTSTSTSTVNKKRATPIAVRRTPRSLIAASVNAPIVVEEAMDAWPLLPGVTPMDVDGAHSELNETKTSVKSETPTDVTTTPANIRDASGECTEDIRLVYEDTIEEVEVATPVKQSSSNVKGPPETIETLESKPVTPQNKTPRRVPFKTISTPKSKKELLE